MRRFLLLILPLSLAAPTFAEDQCKGTADIGLSAPASNDWNGWGMDGTNARYQPNAGLTAAQVPNLKLKWAFGFPAAKQVWGQPTVAGGMVFVSTDTGSVYALGAKTGCLHWTYDAGVGVRTAITIAAFGAPTRESNDGGAPHQGYAAFFGDVRGTAYAVDAATGALLWKTKVDDHASAKITGAPAVYQGRVYVPVASGEEGAGGNPNYACCTFRGSVVALDTQTGKQIWKTYTIAETPKQVGEKRFGPAGAGVWSPPTIDPKRGVLYVGTGDAYTEPAAPTTDAIVAMALDTGKIVWSVQDTENDTWLAGCTADNPRGNCPKALGPDHDYGSAPMLKTLAGGRQLLIAGQKSGNVWAHDPDNKGAVVWRTALVNNTKEFGGKIVWGGSADDSLGYFGLGPGGIGAVSLKDGERKWFADIKTVAGQEKHPGQEGPLTTIPGIVFSAAWDGMIRALSVADGKVVWEFNALRDFQTVNGVAAKGGSMGAAGPVVANGMLYVPSGYAGVRQGTPGNVLLAFGQ